MPTYTLQANLKTNRKQAAASLAVLFGHLDALGIDLTDIAIVKTGGSQGAVTVTTTQAIPAEQIPHLGLS